MYSVINCVLCCFCSLQVGQLPSNKVHNAIMDAKHGLALVMFFFWVAYLFPFLYVDLASVTVSRCKILIILN